MSLESPEPLAAVVRPAEAPADIVVANTVSPTVTPVATPEQIRAVEAVFARKEQESALVANLLGMWTGGLLLHDVVADTLAAPEDEPEKKKTRDEPEEPR